MIKDKCTYHILVIEDNPGDQAIVEHYLLEYMENVVIVPAKNFKQATTIFTAANHLFDVILLDLDLPDKQGKDLITAMLDMVSSCPVIILTGNDNLDFSISSISQGIMDYLIKDELSAVVLYKSIMYSIERNKMITDLAISKNKYGNLFKFSHEPMWVYDLGNGRNVQINKAAIRQYGFSVEEFTVKPIEDFFLPELRAMLPEKFTVIKKEGYHIFESIHLRKDLSVFPVIINASVVLDEPGKILFSAINMEDLVNSKQAEQLLIESEQRFNSLLASLNDAVITFNNKGIITGWNKGAEKIFGYAPSEITGQEIKKLLTNNFINKHREKIQTLDIKGYAEVIGNNIEMQGVHQNGHECQIEVSMAYWEIAAGIYYTAIIRDISDRLSLINGFQEKQRSLFELIAGANVGTWEWNIQSGETKYNKQWGEIIGYSMREIAPQNIQIWEKYTNPEDLNRAKDLLQKHFNGELDFYECELRMKHKDGHWVWALDRGKVHTWDKEGKPLLMSGTHQEITHRNKSEEKNTYEAIRYQTLLQTSSDGIHIIDETGTLIEVNKAFCNMLGYTREELMKLKVEDWDSKWKGDKLLGMISKMISKNAPTMFETIHHRKDGSIYNTEINVIPIELDGHTYLYNSARNITQRKQVEEELVKMQEMYRGLSEATFEAIFLSEKGVLIEQNTSAEKMFGYTNAEAVGRYGTDLVMAEDRKMVFNLMVNDNDGPYEAMALRKDGTSFPCMLHGKKMNYKGRDVRVTSLVDITERRRIQNAVNLNHEKYKTMVNASPDGIILIDLKARVTEISDIGLSLFGFNTREDILNKKIFEFIPDSEIKTIKKLIRQTMVEGICQNQVLTLIKNDKTVFLSEVGTTLLQGLDQKANGFIVIIRDITDRKKQETLKIHADRMATLGGIASGIAHEINQPLNNISMVMDKILFTYQKNQAFDFGTFEKKSNKIFENIIRIRNIIDNVRNFSKSHENYVLVNFDINSSINNAVSMIGEQFKNYQITLTLELQDQCPEIFGNMYKLEQVIINLLINAKDAVLDKKNVQKEFTDMKVKIRSYQLDQVIVIEVADNGIGISEKDINQVMVPFYTTKPEGKGTGLGLSISYEIIKEMGGKVEIMSDLQTGTTVKIILDKLRER